MSSWQYEANAWELNGTEGRSELDKTFKHTSTAMARRAHINSAARTNVEPDAPGHLSELSELAVTNRTKSASTTPVPLGSVLQPDVGLLGHTSCGTTHAFQPNTACTQKAAIDITQRGRAGGVTAPARTHLLLEHIRWYLHLVLVTVVATACGRHIGAAFAVAEPLLLASSFRKQRAFHRVDP